MSPNEDGRKESLKYAWLEGLCEACKLVMKEMIVNDNVLVKGAYTRFGRFVHREPRSEMCHAETLCLGESRAMK